MRIDGRALVVAASLALLALANASAQEAGRLTGLKLDGDKPIQIESDNLEIREQEKRAFFTGNVRVAQGDMTLRASKMTVYYKSGTKSIAAGGTDIDRIEVAGDVKLASARQQATADNGSPRQASTPPPQEHDRSRDNCVRATQTFCRRFGW